MITKALAFKVFIISDGTSDSVTVDLAKDPVAFGGPPIDNTNNSSAYPVLSPAFDISKNSPTDVTSLSSSGFGNVTASLNRGLLTLTFSTVPAAGVGGPVTGLLLF